MISLEKWMILTPIQKLPNNIGNLGEILFFFKMGHSRPLFFIFRLFYKQLTVTKCSIKVADDWIRTQVLSYHKRPLCQLRHNHFPRVKFCCHRLWMVVLSAKNRPIWSHCYYVKTAMVTFEETLCNFLYHHLRLVHITSNENAKFLYQASQLCEHTSVIKWSSRNVHEPLVTFAVFNRLHQIHSLNTIS